MIKKITLAVLLTIVILAFPVRLLGLSQNLELIVKLVKGLSFIIICILLMRQDNILSNHILLKKLTAKISRTLLPVVILVTCYLIYAIGKQLRDFQADAQLVILSLAASLVAAAAEEFMFRGYILNVLSRNKNSLMRSLIISSTIFALLHIGNIFRFEDGWSVVNQTVFAFVLGMLFGSVYVLTGNLLVVSIFHFFVNIPAALQKVNPTNTEVPDIAPSSLLDNIISFVFMVILMIPFLLLAFYYIKIAIKNNHSVEKELAMIN